MLSPSASDVSRQSTLDKIRDSTGSGHRLVSFGRIIDQFLNNPSSSFGSDKSILYILIKRQAASTNLLNDSQFELHGNVKAVMHLIPANRRPINNILSPSLLPNYNHNTSIENDFSLICSVSAHALISLVSRALNTLPLRIELWEEEPKLAGKKRVSNVNSLCKKMIAKGTPGNPDDLLDALDALVKPEQRENAEDDEICSVADVVEALFEQPGVASPVVASLVVSKESSASMVIIDMLEYKAWMVDDIHNSPIVEAVIIQLGVKELLVASKKIVDEWLPVALPEYLSIHVISNSSTPLENDTLTFFDKMTRVLDEEIGMPLPKEMSLKACTAWYILLEYLSNTITVWKEEVNRSSDSIIPLVEQDKLAQYRQNDTKIKTIRGQKLSSPRLILCPFVPQKIMRLDETALRALHIFPEDMNEAFCSSLRNVYSQTNSNVKSFKPLFSLLSEATVTGHGKRLIERWLRQPILDMEVIEQRQASIGIFRNIHDLGATLREALRSCTTDLSKLMKKMIRGKYMLADLVAIHQTVSIGVLKVIHTILDRKSVCEQSDYRHLQKMIEKLVQLRDEEMRGFMEMMTHMVINSKSDYEEGHNQWIIKPEIEPRLTELSQQRASLFDQLKEEFEISVKELKKATRQLGLKIKLEENSVYGWHMRALRSDLAPVQQYIREQLEKMEESKTKMNISSKGSDCLFFRELNVLKGGLLFTTAHMSYLSTQLSELQGDYQKCQAGIISEMGRIAVTYRGPCMQINDLIATLDALQSMATFTLCAPGPYTRPTLVGTNERFIKIINGRHPCIDSPNFIPNDLQMLPGCHLALITGPNMGGKSTFIKQCALIAIIAQIGCWVPANEALLPLFDAVLVRVGAGDSLFRGMSTFMTEMIECASMCKAATGHSMVIIDEVGRGTDPEEGEALAQAIAEYFVHDRGCVGLFATHFHGLAENLQESCPGGKCSNLYMSVNRTQDESNYGIKLLYKVKPGVSKESLGIYCAKMAGFPTQAIQLALLYKDCVENKFERDPEQVKEAERWCDECLEHVERCTKEFICMEDAINEFLLICEPPKLIAPYFMANPPI